MDFLSSYEKVLTGAQLATLCLFWKLNLCWLGRLRHWIVYIILCRNKNSCLDFQASFTEDSNLEILKTVFVDKETSQYFIHSKHELTPLGKEIFLQRKLHLEASTNH